MLSDGWIKLHRKVLDNGILRDQNAWTIFSWLMLKVDRETGKKIIGRFWASEELGIKPTTFYKALKRLEKKWQMVTLTSNNQSTEVTLVNWFKYQNGNSDGNTSVTTREQPSNTLQEERRKNKEKNSPLVVPPKGLMDITEADLEEISDKYHIPLAMVKLSYEHLQNYCLSKGKTYKDYKAALRNFVLKDAERKVDQHSQSSHKVAIDGEAILRERGLR